MTTPEIKKILAFKPDWPVTAIQEFYGISRDQLNDLAAPTNGEDGVFDRFKLEIILQRKKMVSLKHFAIENGVTFETMKNAMEDTSRKPVFHLEDFGEGKAFLFSREYAEGWIKTRQKDIIYGSLESMSRRLAKDLGGETIVCAVSKKFRIEPTTAHCICIATWDTVSITHQEILKNNKPFVLAPDRVGWHAIYDDSSWSDYLWQPDSERISDFFERSMAVG
ncbi:MAG: hypothetical protein JJU29_22380 [Verrucomicrobia bacterium]|nr:hypothetical protein [Verrucomicrobiota bacterium]MCH8514555.1 hypothetical protein [Kiritimatiellia bacterium]